jgi:hypothetical protein
VKYEITQELLQALVNYLAGKPYAETFQLIAALQQLPKVEEARAQPAPIKK